MLLLYGIMCALTPITTSRTKTKYQVQNIEKTPMYVGHPSLGVMSTKLLRFLLIHSTKGLQNCSSSTASFPQKSHIENKTKFTNFPLLRGLSLSKDNI